MKPEERQRFRQMTRKEKLEHLWTYYKLPIFGILLCLFVLLSTLRHFALQKEPVLYLAQINVAAGEDLNRSLNEGYLQFSGGDPRKEEVSFYKNLYLSDNASTENHEYAYASSMKLMAAINAKELDLVLMNREAYDLCSRSGYLMDLENLIPPALIPQLTQNEVILEDNSLDVALNEASEYRATTSQAPNALRVDTLPLFTSAGFPEPVYLGIIANSPRMEACAGYLQYLGQAYE